VSFLSNFFSEWLTIVPGPPADVLSRIDAILTNHDMVLRDSLKTGLVAWPSYRSCFAELLYLRNWLELMDIILSSCPQFLEFLSVAWIVLNGRQIAQDHSTFHSANRPVKVALLVSTARAIEANAISQLKSMMYFRPLSPGHYPVIEAGEESVALRSLQGDYDQLAEMQATLLQERQRADAAERTKKRRQETYDSISQLHAQKENSSRIDAARAGAELEHQMARLRLEGKRLRQNEERLFLDSWVRDWDVAVDLGGTSLPSGDAGEGPVMEQSEILVQTMMNFRQSDSLLREARRVATTRARHARGEIESQLHDTELKNELRRIATNSALLLSTAPIKASGSKSSL
jgi:hypothetical protein